MGVSTSLWTMDHFGRRPLLLWGSVSMTIAHLIIAVLVGKFSSNWSAHRDAGWASVAFVHTRILHASRAIAYSYHSCCSTCSASVPRGVSKVSCFTKYFNLPQSASVTLVALGPYSQGIHGGRPSRLRASSEIVIPIFCDALIFVRRP